MTMDNYCAQHKQLYTRYCVYCGVPRTAMPPGFTIVGIGEIGKRKRCNAVVETPAGPYFCSQLRPCRVHDKTHGKAH